MYTARLKTLIKAYKRAERDNALYTETENALYTYNAQLNYLSGWSNSIQKLGALITSQEEKWQRAILDMFEEEIQRDLAFVFPDDGYNVSLTSRVLRGKVHIDAAATSFFAGTMQGEISDSQGRLFQQVVSFAALVCIMRFLNVNTIYVDEAFSGASTMNIYRVNQLLKSIQERGYNIILIAQNMDMASNIDANVLMLQRTLDNKTLVTQKKGG